MVNGQWLKKFKSRNLQSQNKPSYYNPSSPERLPEGNDGLGLNY